MAVTPRTIIAAETHPLVYRHGIRSSPGIADKWLQASEWMAVIIEIIPDHCALSPKGLLMARGDLDVEPDDDALEEAALFSECPRASSEIGGGRGAIERSGSTNPAARSIKVRAAGASVDGVRRPIGSRRFHVCP